MCGIFGILSKKNVNIKDLFVLAKHARQRGRDSSGLVWLDERRYKIKRADQDIIKTLKSTLPIKTNFIMGHSRLITNGFSDNQPVLRDDICVIHNGIIVNDDQIWKRLRKNKHFSIDTEILIGLALEYIEDGVSDLKELPKKILSACKGTVSCAMLFPKIGKLLLFSNNGSLYIGGGKNEMYFSSEKYPLEALNCCNIKQVWDGGLIFDVPIKKEISTVDLKKERKNLIPTFKNISFEEKMLAYNSFPQVRCKKCILPATMPFISFDSEGVCNYCNNYQIRNKPKPKKELFSLIEPYRRSDGPECIVPFSGGRDSCWGLHLIVKELNLKPITYTYDWGMVTDLGRRNISRMCSELGVENIIIAADISKKRRNIALNLKAWMKSPHLGMISIFTAGDKHFFRHIETVKNQTNVKLNLWGINPLEVTHFKSGFLGIPPDFVEKMVYSHGVLKQLNYQWTRFKEMLNSPGYFNSSLFDTISGEYYRSFTQKSDYYHIFDYWAWDEKTCDQTLSLYDWELAKDTITTWRIGDGTAAFYNYIYYTVAGFTEHDTFRSNQIREGQITREKALSLVKEENKPRYQNIKWYLDALDMNFEEVVGVINKIPPLYEK